MLESFRQQIHKSLFMLLLKNSSLLTARFEEAPIATLGPIPFFCLETVAQKGYLSNTIV